MMIKKVGVVGCGLMGHGIAQVAAQGGFQVVAVETDRKLLDAGLARIDLDDQTVDYAGGVVRFEVEEDVKHRLLGGHDEISITLQNGDAIDAYEAAHPVVGRATTAI